MIELKSEREIRLMREAGRIVAAVLRELAAALRPGITTADLDRLAERLIREAGAEPAFKGYQGFPASICTSINDEVVHGIPSAHRVIREGDVVSIDVGARYQGYYGDSAATFAVGTVPEEVRRLLEVTRQSLAAGIAAARAGNRLGDIGHAVQQHVEAAGFSVVRDYAGHGIGRAMHEDPQVPNYGRPGTGLRLRPGLVIAIEPMVNAGGHAVKTDPDGWTVRTVDGSLSAHFEHTVLITGGEPEVLTAGAF
ncbi:methionine aminopeptidase, type I [Thermaerobacter marianensis DSM 12885]|uniref:Methionine aminopeptidase n=1 Tax=Thermaerobacter marianensis (strain ATCC 700841 / DSM 12885 / JCM 10246 / 7p75a) TaxID=644966 RepID=E6SKX9_THEM7|nr:type I methionyl aminopeptidase [Thermaerobacter marianensis]ADU52352.1 methionine aminopeptidase, type I [Thermaerobacter marianensis DSM 12885]